MTKKNFNQYLQRPNMPIILSIYLSEIPSDKNFIETLTYITELIDPSSNLNLSIDEKMPKIIFKMKKYYVIYIQNEKNMDFDIPETVTKNILIYRIFSKED